MSPVAAKLAALIPVDACTVFEMCRSGDSVAQRFRLRNPTTAFMIESLPLSRSLDDLARGLATVSRPFDAVLLHEDVLQRPDPFAVLATVLPHLRADGSLLMVLPWAWCEQRRIAAGGASVIAAIEAALADGPLRDSGLGVDCAARITRTDDGVPRLIVRAVRKKVFRRLYLGAMTLRPAGACNDTRIDLPNAFLETIPGVRCTTSVEHILNSARLSGERRIAILQRRIASPADLPDLKGLLREGYLLVSEFDDHPNHWPNMVRNQYLTFRGVHAVQTSTDFLAGELRGHNPEIQVFPNQIATLPPPRQPRADGRLALFFGAFNRGGDWRPLMGPLNRILAANRNRIGVQVVHDRAFFDALDTENKAFIPTCGYDVYIQALRRCDIGLLPLNDTLFNRSKSDLKFIECAAHGVAALASPVIYAETLRDGDTGVLFHSPAEFAAGLTRLIEDADWRAGIAANAYGYVRDHRLMAQHFRKRLDWYHSLLDRKEELDARLYERVPELRP